MPQPISGLPAVLPAVRPDLASASPAARPSTDFQSVLLKALEDVNRLDGRAQDAVARGLTDPQGLQSDTYVHMMQADLAFRTMLQIRNKLVEAYNEIRQMQV